MNCKHLWVVMVPMLLVSCNVPKLEESESRSNFNFYKDIQSLEHWEQNKIIHNNTLQYLFNGSYVEEFIPAAESEFNYVCQGTLSRAAKELVKKIWSALKQKGFSGYNDSALNSMMVQYEYKKPHLPIGGGISDLSHKYQHVSFTSLPFHSKALNVLMDQHRGIRYLQRGDASFREKLFNPALIGLSFNGKRLYWHDKHELIFASEQSIETDQRALPIPRISQQQLDEWNQVFIDALREDSFFKQFFTEAVPEDSSSSVSLRAGRLGASGLDATALTLNGVSGNRVDLGLPLFVQLKGSVDGGKSTTGTTGVVAYRLGNTVIGAVQAYANSGEGFGSDSRQLEISVVASHSFGGFFVEGQLGAVSANNVHTADWSGVRSQVTLGYDFDTVSPFVQLTHRDFGDRTDTAAYAGVEMDLSEFKIPEATFNTHLLTKVGHHSMNGFSGSVEWSGSLTLNSGVSFSTNLGLDTVAGSAAKFNISVER